MPRHVLVACSLLAWSACAPREQGTPTGASTQPAAAGSPNAGATPSTPTAPAASTNPNAAAVPSAPSAPPLAPVCSPTAPADVQVTVTSKAGPLGAGAPRPLSNKLWSMNIDDLQPQDYAPTLDANFVAYLKALKPAMLRWPSGVNSQYYQYSETKTGKYVLSPAFLDHFIALCRAVNAEPFIGVNTLNGSPENAAALVKFLNVTRGYKVRYFHLGNEPGVNGVTATSSPQTYAATFLRFQQAMRAADANIKFVGAELMTGGEVLGISPYVDWLTPILQGTQRSPMDAVAWHYYPKDSSQTNVKSSAAATPNNLLIETANDWPPAGMDFPATILPKIKGLLGVYAPKAEIWVDEIAEDSGKANGVGTAELAVGALWLADELGRFAEYGTDAAFRFIFKTSADHGYALLDPTNHPRPDYYAYWLYAQQFGDQMVGSTTSDLKDVAVHAATRTSDGTLRVMLVNKTTHKQAVNLKLTDYAPTTAFRYLLQGEALTSTSMTLNGAQLTPTNLAAGAAAVAAVATTDACASNVLSLPPVSVTVMVFAHSE